MASMNYSMSFGNISAQPKPRPGVGEVFGLAVLGDFSGRANKGELETGAALAARKPRRIDVDNIDDVLASMQLKLCLPIGDDGAAVEVEINSMDDFHPDELYENVEAFAELSMLRRKLQKSSSFAAAAEEVRSWAGEAPTGPRVRPKARGSAVPNAKLSDFSRLMGAATSTHEASPADELIKQIVRPFIKPSDSPDQAEMVASVDAALSSMMRRLLHHPDFQTLESLWRSVELYVRELETDGTLQVILYDISAEEIAADLSSADNLEETGLYQLFVEQPSVDTRTVPPSVIVGNYLFEQTPPHAELLGRVAKIAAAAQAPFIASIGTDAMDKKKPEEIHPLVAESWGALRSLPQAPYLGLVTPRFMLRWPYGAKTEPIDPFDFEEFTPRFGLKGFLWANGANLAGLLLGKTFAQQGFKAMEPGAVMVQGELPLYFFVDSDGDQIPLPCTERLATEAVATHTISQGFMPIVWMKGRPEVRLGAFVAVNGDRLAGAWAPVGFSPDAPAAAAAPAAAPAAEPDPEPAAAEDDSDSDDLDDLLGDLDDMDTDESDDTVDSAEDDGDDDLDALLASIEGDAEEDNNDGDSDEMDPDLAALLADL